MKLDVDFASKNWLKDAYLRWHTNKNGFLRVGNFAEPFSAENIQSTMDYPFINKSATVAALGTNTSGLRVVCSHRNSQTRQKLSKAVIWAMHCQPACSDA